MTRAARMEGPAAPSDTSPAGRSRLRFSLSLLMVAMFAAAAVVYSRAWPGAPWVVSDSGDYMEVAADLQNDHHLDTLHDRTPGYPWLLVLSRSAVRPTRALFVLQLLMHFAAVALVAAILWRRGVPVPALAACVLLAMLPPSVAPATCILTESLAEFLLASGVVGLLLWVEGGLWLWLAGAALAMAYAGITRPVYLVLSVVIGAVLLALRGLLPSLRRRLLVGALVMTALGVAFAGGLVGFNAVRFGYLGATPLFGFNLCTRTYRFVERLPQEHAALRDILVEERDLDITKRDPSHNGTMYIWGARSRLQAATGLDEPALSRLLLRLNLQLIARAPLEYLSEVSRAAGSFWFPCVADAANFGSRGLQLVWVLVDFCVTALLALHTLGLAGYLGVYTLVPGLRRVLRCLLAGEWATLLAMALALLVIAYTMAVSITVEIGAPRYRAPTSLLALFTIALGIGFWQRVRWRACGWTALEGTGASRGNSTSS